MKRILSLAIAGIMCITAVLSLASCSNKDDDKTKDSTGTNTESINTEAPETTPVSDDKLNEIFDSLMDNVELKDGRIYLFFGARVTLTVENFNKLILEDQLGLDLDTYTLVFDEDALEALKADDAYGGIGFGQELIATFNVSLKNLKTNEVTEPKELIFTLNKSEEADAKLNPAANDTNESNTETDGQADTDTSGVA